ncbi:MAG: DUF4214 domain-containing protein [Pseudomonadota bacterium]
MATIVETTDLPDFFNATTPITENDTFNGQTEVEFDTDWIPVQLFADRSYIVQRTQGENGRAFIGILDDTGTEIGSFESNVTGDSQVVVTVPTDGIYYIETSADRFTGGPSLDYTITILSEVGDNVNTAEALPFDLTTEPVAVYNGIFEHSKDTDYIAVELETGYTYQVIPQTNESNSRFFWVDELGNTIDPDYGSTGIGVTVETAGTYYLVATTDINRSRPNELNNQYRLTIEVEPPENEDTVFRIAPGETVAEKYDGFGDIDWFAVSMSAGFSYYIERDAGSIQNLDFVEPDGDAIAQTSFTSSRGNYQAVTPQLAGEYFVQVIPNDAYRISLIQEVAGDVSTASRVAVGRTEESTFDFFNDEDVFALSVIEGATYSAVATLDPASLLSLSLTAIDSDDIETRTFFDTDQVELTFEAPNSEQMFLKVSSTGTLSDSDGYSLSVQLESFGDNATQGTDGDDSFDNTNGNDIFDGRGGQDRVVYADASTNYTVSLRPSGDVVVFDRDGNQDIDFLLNVETIVFSDREVDLTQYGSASQLSSLEMVDLAKIYAAYFNRAPDSEGLFFWADKLAEGLSIEAIAEFFFDQDETRALYPDPANTDAFVTSIYANVLGRVPDGAGFDFWTEQLSLGNVTQGSFVLEIIRGAQGDDITYLQNKAELGVSYSAIGGLSDVANGGAVFSSFGNSDLADLAGARQAADSFVNAANQIGSGTFVFRTLDVVDDPFAIA